MNVPKNVIWFEVLLYLSLTLDALSVAFQDRTPSDEMTEQMITAATVIAGGMILLLVYFVWLAAQRRKNWPRWVLCRGAGAVGDFAGAGHRRQRLAARQRHRDRVLRPDRGRAVFFLHRRRQGLVQRVAALYPGCGAARGHRRPRIRARADPGPAAHRFALRGIGGMQLRCAQPRNPVHSPPWNGPTKASCWGCGGMANPPPSSNS